jgi:hypothetical protein
MTDAPDKRPSAKQQKLAALRAAATRDPAAANGNTPQADTPTPTTPLVPAQSRPAVQANPPGQTMSNFRLLAEPAHASQKKIRGGILRCKKGVWLADGGARVVPLGTRMAVQRMEESLCIFDDQTVVWELFRQEGVPFPAVIDLPGLVPAEIAHLVSRDKSTWRPGPSGQPSDPVQLTFYVGLLERGILRDYTFITNTWGGMLCVRELARQIAVHEAQTGGAPAYAVVELQTAERKSPRFDVIKGPALPIVGWIGPDMRPLPMEPPAALDDDIAF